MEVIIAITGASGFIGSYVVRELLDSGHKVKALGRDPAKFIPQENLEWVQGDLHNPQALNLLLQDADSVCHCAGEFKDPASFHLTNLEGTRKIFLSAKEHNVRHFVQLSSVGVYGHQTQGTISENHPHKAMNAYEESKILADEWLLSQTIEDLQLSIVRPSIVFGPDMKNHSLRQFASMIKRKLFFFIGPPGASANYIHVQNVAHALALLATHRGPMAKRIYNLSDWMTMEEFVHTMAKGLNVPPPNFRLPYSLVYSAATVLESLCPRAVPLTRARIKALTSRARYDTPRIADELGYRPQISLSEGLFQTLNSWNGKEI